MNIKCVTYSRYSTSVPIYTFMQEHSNKLIAAEAEKMNSKIKAVKPKTNERYKIESSYGVWFCLHDENDICYAICTADNYPERHAFGLIQKLRENVKKIDNFQYKTEEDIKNFTKRTTNSLAAEYNDLKNIDKIHRANSEVKELEGELGTGIKKLINNQESLEDMNERASRLKQNAICFDQNSQKLERMLYWRNVKLKIIIALCVIGLLGFVILTIVQATKGSTATRLLRRV